MTTGEGPNPREGQPRPEADAARRGDRIGVGGADDNVSLIQLAARWAEAYTNDGEALAAMLKRFRAAHEYLDAVIHGVEPPDVDSAAEQTAPAAQPPGPVAPPAWGEPEPTPPPPPPPASPPPPSWTNP